MSNMTAVSLFAGVEGIGLALEAAGVTVTAAVEIDDAARGVIADRRPNTHLFTDVTKVTPDELRATGFVPERGIISAGFPCQDLSVAGRRAGLGGARSGLFWHVMRLADALRPQWLLLENVPGLLSSVCATPEGDDGDLADLDEDGLPAGDGPCTGGCMAAHGGAMGTVLGAVGELGYGFSYRVLDAQFFGVPQRRRRVFIVGCLGDAGRPVQVLLEPEGRGGNPPKGQQAGAGVAATLTSGTSGTGVSAPGRRQEDDVNLVVAEVASILQGGGKRGHRIDAESAAGGHLVMQTYQKVIRSGERDKDGNLPPEVWAERPVAATLNLNDLGSESRSVELVVSATGDVTHTLTAEGHDASEDGTGRGTPIVFSHIAGIDQQASEHVTPTVKAGHDTMPSVSTGTTVRRLTPMECERLQGFPDGWTLTSGGKPQADSARYRQMGNAVAVPCVAWIARRIVEVAA